MPYTQEELAAEKQKHMAWLREQTGFNGAGMGINAQGDLCIKIMSNQMTPETKAAIQSRLRDVPLEFEESGEFRKFS